VQKILEKLPRESVDVEREDEGRKLLEGGKEVIHRGIGIFLHPYQSRKGWLGIEHYPRSGMKEVTMAHAL
jgi:hypothetical protein